MEKQGKRKIRVSCALLKHNKTKWTLHIGLLRHRGEGEGKKRGMYVAD